MWRGRPRPRKVGSKKRPAIESAFSYWVIGLLGCWVVIPSRDLQFALDFYTSNSTNSARTFPASIISRPTLTGKWKRRGPALPGLK